MTRRAGYTLFEVLLAFAIMSMILAVLLPRQAELQARLRAVDDRALALDYALSRTALLGVVDPVQPGVRTTGYRGWTVEERIEPLAPDGTSVALARVTVAVTDARGRPLAAHETRRALDERP